MSFLKKNLLIDEIKNIIPNCKNNYLIEEELLDYYAEYGKEKKYNFFSTIFETKESKLFLPYTIDKSNNCDFFGSPINFFYQKNISTFNDDLINFFKKLNFNKQLILNLKIEKNLNNLSRILSQIKKNEEIYEDTTIDLKLTNKEIFKQFSKGHRYEVNRKTNLEYIILDWTNYKKEQILEMMSLHEVVSNKKTRSTETWMINEKMIMNKKGFLIFVFDQKKIISASFFFMNNFSSIYFSSCTIRDYFVKTGITHKTIWYAIQYLKKNNCNYFHLGRSKTYFTSVENIKERNIEKFKHSFGGIKSLCLKTSSIPEAFEN